MLCTMSILHNISPLGTQEKGKHLGPHSGKPGHALAVTATSLGHYIFIERVSQVSGSITGDVKYWDTRTASSISTHSAFGSGKMTSLAVHDIAPLYACGSARQEIKLFNSAGGKVRRWKHHDSFMGQRIGKVVKLAFHPNRLCLAAGFTDSIVSVYTYQ